jgi:predicted dienelactone hydrolase
MNHIKSALSFICFLTLALSACGSSETEATPSTGLDYNLQDEGPFRVGYTTFETSYVAPGQTEPRTISVYLWYPTEDVHNDQAVPPTESPIYIDLFVDSDTIIDATPTAPVYDAGYPLLAYSHGSQGVAQGSWRLMRYFASHGWVALSVGHVGNMLVEGSDAGNTPIEHWHHRPLDISAGIDAVEALSAPEALAGQIDTSRVLLTGHSRGAYTTWAMGGATYDIENIQARCDGGSYPNGCTAEAVTRFGEGFLDSRIKALIPTAGSGHGEFFDNIQGRESVELPIFMMSATEDQVGMGDVFTNTNLSNFSWVEIDGGCHELFNLGCGRMEDSAKFPIVTTYSLAFGRHYILDDMSDNTVGILDQSVPVSEHVTTFMQK